jgi:hypothetical protein
MKMHFITFRSITPAQRGERLLKQAGIDAWLQRTPRWMEAQGCGYCLRLPEHRTQAAVALLQRDRIPFSKVYAWNAGRAEEWKP